MFQIFHGLLVKYSAQKMSTWLRSQRNLERLWNITRVFLRRNQPHSLLVLLQVISATKHLRSFEALEITL